jgi:hypothetical protein
VVTAFAILAGTSCEPTPAAPPPASATVAVRAWEAVDPAFAGCQGSCGAHVEGPSDEIATQPGARVGALAFCPVSGAVFTVSEAHAHADVEGGRLWFCCAACAAYFEAHRDVVLAARGVTGPGG